MPILDARTGRVLFTILLIAAGMAFVWKAWHVLAAFLFAIFFAYLVYPVVELLSRRLKISRGKSIAAVYLVIFAALAVVFLSVGPKIVREGESLANTIPQLYQKIASGQIAWQLGAQHGWSYDTKLKMQQFLASHRETIVQIARDYGMRLAELGRNAWWLLLIPILAVFFLKDGEQLRASLLDAFERRRQRDFVERVLNDVHMMLAHYIRAQLTLAALAMTVYVTGLSLLRVPYGYVMGIIAGFLEFIPIVGPLISTVLIVGVALGAGYKHILLLLLFLGVWRGLQDYFNSPRIMGKSLELHPLAALFGILAGGEVGGIIGVFLSIPVMATLRIFWRRWRAYDRMEGTTVAPVSDYASVPQEAGGKRAA